MLNKVLVFNKLEPHLQRKVVVNMYEQCVSAGEILIKEGDSGAAASELYVVKSGKFEVRHSSAQPLAGWLASELTKHRASAAT
jgi:CRP-like cAMP-binding protein